MTAWVRFGSRNWESDRDFHQQLHQEIHTIKGIVVDGGCGKKPFEALLAPCASHYIGLDHQAPEDNVVADITRLPLATSIDTEVCFQVLDDIAEPIVFLDEVHQVLCPGGLLLLSVNQVWWTHDPPKDYYTQFGLKYVLEKSHLTVVRIDAMEGSGRSSASASCSGLMKTSVASASCRLLQQFWGL